MYASAIPLAVTFGCIFSPLEGLGQIGLFLWLMGFAILVRASMSLYHVPHMALGAELTSDYYERTVVVAYRSGFGTLGIALVLGLILFFATPGVQDALNVHMGTYFWNLAASEIQLLQAAAIPALILGLPFWVAMTHFIDKGRSFLIGIALLTIFSMICPLLQIIGWPSRSRRPWVSASSSLV